VYDDYFGTLRHAGSSRGPEGFSFQRRLTQGLMACMIWERTNDVDGSVALNTLIIFFGGSHIS
jgi:hypothetical protein